MTDYMKKKFENEKARGDALLAELKIEVNKNAKLIAVLHKYNEEARKFIKKIDTGLARSVETYEGLKTCLALAENLEDGK